MPGSRWVVSLLLLCALLGCARQGPGGAPAVQEPRLGASRPVPSKTPGHAMDELEEPVEERLASQLEDDGLTLQYVECPPWSGAVPAVLECKGYVDGVVGKVVVELSHRAGGRVQFDARLEEGVLAVRRLVRRLERDGYRDVDCGETPAYPARAGTRIVCRGKRGGHVSQLVATVVDRHGAVRLEER